MVRQNMVMSNGEPGTTVITVVITVRLFSRLLSACRHSWRQLCYFRRVWIRDNRTTPPNRNTKPSSWFSGAPLNRSFHRSHTVINTCSRVHRARVTLWSKPLAFDHWKIRGQILSRIQNISKMELTVSWPISNVSLKFNSTSVHSFSSYFVHRQTWINASCKKRLVREDELVFRHKQCLSNFSWREI